MVDEITIEKYLQGIVTINSTLGRLDVLRLKLTDDKMSVAIIEAIMNDLSKVCGVNYKSIDFDLSQLNKTENKTEIKREPIVVDIFEEKHNRKSQNTNVNKVYVAKEEKKEIENLGVRINDNGNLIYNFQNSNTLSFMIYNKEKESLMMTFKQNGRSYEYYNVPIRFFDNLVNIDEKGSSAGAYFQQNIAKVWKNYKEITNSMLIG